MRGGRLRKRLNIESYTSTGRDAHGAPGRTWNLVARVWGAINPGGGKEIEQASGSTEVTTHKITIRYFSKLTAQMRITYASKVAPTIRIFNICGITNTDERNREMVIDCIEGKPNG